MRFVSPRGYTKPTFKHSQSHCGFKCRAYRRRQAASQTLGEIRRPMWRVTNHERPPGESTKKGGNNWRRMWNKRKGNRSLYTALPGCAIDFHLIQEELRIKGFHSRGYFAVPGQRKKEQQRCILCQNTDCLNVANQFVCKHDSNVWLV